MIQVGTELDFDWIYKMHGKYSDTLGAPYPAAIRQDLTKGRIIIDDEKQGFCQYTPMNRNPYSTVHTICVGERARRKHLASSFLDYIMDKHDSDIQAVCIKDSISEKFWANKGKLIGTKQSKKGTELCIYFVENTNKKTVKNKLF